MTQKGADFERLVSFGCHWRRWDEDFPGVSFIIQTKIFLLVSTVALNLAQHDNCLVIRYNKCSSRSEKII